MAFPQERFKLFRPQAPTKRELATEASDRRGGNAHFYKRADSLSKNLRPRFAETIHAFNISNAILYKIRADVLNKNTGDIICMHNS